MPRYNINENQIGRAAFWVVGLVSAVALMRKFGVFDIKRKQIEQFERSGALNPFNYGLFKLPVKVQGKSLVTLTPSMIKVISYDLKTELDSTNVDENKVISIFKKMKTKSDVYFVNGYTSEKYKFDVWNDLRSDLNDGEVFNIVTYVKDLPSYVQYK